MNLREYYEQFLEHLTGQVEQNFPVQVAAEVTAAHSIGLSFEQLQQFLARRAEITSVAFALKGDTLPVDKIERILAARNAGAVHPRDVLTTAFAPHEIREKFTGTNPTNSGGA